MTPNRWIVKTDQQRINLIAFFRDVELPDCGIIVEWANADSKRTSEQNALLWVSAYRPIAQFMTEQSGKIITSEMVHAVAKDRFLDPVVVEYKGKSKSYPGSTTKLGKQAFSDYIEQVYAWGATMGCYFEN